MQALQLAMSHSVCDFSAVQRRGGGGGTQIILQNRKTKETESAQREGMSNARRFSEEKAGQRESERDRERDGKVSE